MLRLLNPTDESLTATVRLARGAGEARAVRLDETPAEHPLERDGDALRVALPAHALRSIWLP